MAEFDNLSITINEFGETVLPVEMVQKISFYQVDTINENDTRLANLFCGTNVPCK